MQCTINLIHQNSGVPLKLYDMLNINNVTYSYEKKLRQKEPVIKDYSLKVEEGIICGLLGRNGAGKSTLLYLMTGLLFPQSGTIEFNGMNPSERSIEFLRDVFIVPEEFQLPNVTLKDYITYTAPLYPKFDIESLRGHLTTFELDESVHLGKLSMGQKKRVFLCFALACNTSLLILDEPTNGLDIPGKRMFRKAILNGMTENKTIIISTHQVHDVERLLDQVVITDTDGVILNSSLNSISEKLSFGQTANKQVAEDALIMLETPGGYNIIEENKNGSESDVNLESLFELCRQYPETIKRIFK